MLTKFLAILSILILCSQVDAAYIGTYSFEPETMFNMGLSGTPCTSDSTVFVTGNSLKCDGNTTPDSSDITMRTPNGSLHTGNAYGGFTACMDVRFETVGIFNQNFLVFYNSADSQTGLLRLTSGGNFSFCNVGACSTSETGSFSVSADTWYRVCFDYQVSADSFKLWVNEEVDANPDITSTLNLTNTDVGRMQLTAANVANYTAYFDNIVINDVSFSGQAELAADMYNAKTYRLLIEQDGVTICYTNPTTFTGRTTSTGATQTNCSACTTTDGYKCVNYTCTEPGTDNSYVNLANTSGLTEGYQLSNITDLTDPEDIYAIMMTTNEKGSGGTTGQVIMKIGTGSGTTCNDSSSMTEATSEYRTFTYVVSGSQFDTITEVNNLVVGLYKTNSNNNQRFEVISVEFAASEPVSSGFGSSGGIIWISKLNTFYKNFFKIDGTAYKYLLG